jgi:hypothetical protein
MARELLAVARDEEQAVVDPEAEADARDDVERVRRDGHRQVEQAQQEQPAEDRERPTDDRQQRGDEAPEHPQRQEEEQRERDALGEREVVLDLPVHLGRRERRAAHRDALDRAEALVDALRRVAPDPLRHVGPRVRGEERRGAVARAKRRRHHRESRLGADRRGDGRQPHVGRPADEHEHLRHGGEPGRGLDRALRADALASPRHEVVGAAAEQPGCLEPDRRGGYREHDRPCEHASRRADRQVAEEPEHRCVGYRFLMTRASVTDRLKVVQLRRRSSYVIPARTRPLS